MDYKERYEQALRLAESEDERIRKDIKRAISVALDYSYFDKETANDCLAWLEKQGELKPSKWTEGDVVRHGGVLALVTNGRKAMKSNCEQITIQYPDEWVKAETKERKYFFEELEKQGEQKPVVIPKFKVGDKVRLKGSCGWYNVTEIRGIEYYLTSNDVVPCLLPICEQDGWELVEQKPADTSELEMKRHNEGYIKGVHDAYDNVNQARSILNQLRRERPKQEWTKEDEIIFNELYGFLNNKTTVVQHDCDFWAHWLKSLKERTKI